jgi:SAM-dependent methyltransferase
MSSNDGAHPDVELVSAACDAVYEGLTHSPTFERIWRTLACGDAYPWEFGHISFLTHAEMEHLSYGLRLGRDGRLVDLACGMGGPGLWIAREAGALLTGVDISAVAVREAARRADMVGMGPRSSFSLGSFTQIPLESSSFDGATTVDAFQYAPDKAIACSEVARVLRPGGRFAFTAFEVDPEKVAGLPVLGTDPVADLRIPLEAAGFRVEVYEETDGWRDRLTAAYSAVLAGSDALTSEMGEAAFAAMRSEMMLTLEVDPYPRRVLCIAVS